MNRFLFPLFLLFLLPSTLFGAELHQVHVEFNYSSSVSGLAGFRLYLAGNPVPVCTTTNPGARQIDCEVLLGQGETSFTMTAFDASNNESAHSNLYAVTVSASPGSANTAPTNTVLPGDIDNNGIIDLNDLHLVQEILAGRTPSQTTYKEADVNGDGKIGKEESQYILQKISGLQ